MGCYYRGGIDCNGYDDCEKCGFNPAVQEKRLKVIMADAPKSDRQIIADLTRENQRLKSMLKRFGLSSQGTYVIRWVD